MLRISPRCFGCQDCVRTGGKSYLFHSKALCGFAPAVIRQLVAAHAAGDGFLTLAGSAELCHKLGLLQFGEGARDFAVTAPQYMKTAPTPVRKWIA